MKKATIFDDEWHMILMMKVSNTATFNDDDDDCFLFDKLISLMIYIHINRKIFEKPMVFVTFKHKRYTVSY